MSQNKRKKADTTVRLPGDFEETLKALLRVPAPPKRKAARKKQVRKK
jgi:hypothetical protein